MGSPNTPSLVVKIRRGLKRALVVPMLYVQARFTSLTFDDIFLDELSKFHYSYYITINQFTNRPPLPMSEKKKRRTLGVSSLTGDCTQLMMLLCALFSLLRTISRINGRTDRQQSRRTKKKTFRGHMFPLIKKKKKRGGKGSFTIRHVNIPGIRTWETAVLTS